MLMYNERRAINTHIAPALLFERIRQRYGKDSLRLYSIRANNNKGVNIDINWTENGNGATEGPGGLDKILEGVEAFITGSESYSIDFGVSAKATKTWNELIMPGITSVSHLSASIIKEQGNDRNRTSRIYPSNREICLSCTDDLYRICEAYLNWSEELRSLARARR
ncbi:MAG: hypothetical protein V1729_06415 [Candidatus Woesearchaeota archaeon]